MGNDFKARYGIPGKEISNLTKRYYVMEGKQNWENVDTFILWCSKNGYKKGLQMRKKNPEESNSPENTYFFSRKEKIRAVKKKKEKLKKMEKEYKSQFCESCKKECPGRGSNGCDAWKEWFISNWDKNIYIAPPKPKPKIENEKPMIFRYEHPDLVREGIVWTGI